MLSLDLASFLEAAQTCILALFVAACSECNWGPRLAVVNGGGEARKLWVCGTRIGRVAWGAIASLKKCKAWKQS